MANYVDNYIVIRRNNRPLNQEEREEILKRHIKERPYQYHNVGPVMGKYLDFNTIAKMPEFLAKRNAVRQMTNYEVIENYFNEVLYVSLSVGGITEYIEKLKELNRQYPFLFGQFILNDGFAHDSSPLLSALDRCVRGGNTDSDVTRLKLRVIDTLLHENEDRHRVLGEILNPKSKSEEEQAENGRQFEELLEQVSFEIMEDFMSDINQGTPSGLKGYNSYTFSQQEREDIQKLVELVEQSKVYDSAQWMVENWGVSHNGFETYIGATPEGNLSILSQTKWTNLEPLLDNWSRMYPDYTFEYSWYEEQADSIDIMGIYRHLEESPELVKSDEPFGAYSELMDACDIKNGDFEYKIQTLGDFISFLEYEYDEGPFLKFWDNQLHEGNISDDYHEVLQDPIYKAFFDLYKELGFLDKVPEELLNVFQEDVV